ncbi:FecR domain-containing protein [Pseudomonas aeruginosa]|uniref:FecR family protein n=1 Tax=Pseudomonas aeruginosa TaxID=287 RepID=UPI0021F24021|nr:FecR domain-containing protein [Pseudomonas aeruginosa]MCV4083389.1 FecR domain-containing protein [Pseudomonas aeruginosa]
MNSPQEQQQIRQQAAEWAIRLDGGDLDRSRREALDGWLAADPRHPAALALAQRTWKQLGSLAEPRTMVQTPVASAPRRAGGRRKGWRGWAAAAAVLLALGSAWSERDAGVSWLADYATGKGEVRILRLVDGSEVELDAQSAIDVAYDSRERRVRLLEGSAIFRAAPRAGRETRPFVVESAGGSTRALGTRFLVSRNDDGSVQVGVLDDLTSWRRGLLVFDEQPLGEVVARLNRYRPGHLLVAPGALAQRRVSGVFRVADLEASLQSISDELGVRSLGLAGVTLLY